MRQSDYTDIKPANDSHPTDREMDDLFATPPISFGIDLSSGPDLHAEFRRNADGSFDIVEIREGRWS